MKRDQRQREVRGEQRRKQAGRGKTGLRPLGDIPSPWCWLWSAMTRSEGKFTVLIDHCQRIKTGCQRNIERSPFSAWVHLAFAVAVGARRATGAAANGARREADRERLTVRGHLLRGNIFSRAIPRNTAQCRAIVSSSELGISDIAEDVAVRAAVFGCATLAHPRRTERPFRHLICDQDAPSMRLARSSSAGGAGRGGPGRSRRAGSERACRPGLPALRRTNFVGDVWT